MYLAEGRRCPAIGTIFCLPWSGQKMVSVLAQSTKVHKGIEPSGGNCQGHPWSLSGCHKFDSYLGNVGGASGILLYVLKGSCPFRLV